ncbi:FO synthase subunit 2 [Williamsia limnetica]|uniref:FO synthase subunit 2 n=2 Tax=Williamsia limnetica TaxID=882452 RepID=A0A318RZT7_WILLI|nr:FO synthase subunit 2 [Williamsia limnetica]
MLRSLVADPSSIDDRQWAVLLGAQGAELDELCALADSARRDVVGDELTFVANRNLETGAVIGSGSSASVEDLVAEAWELGATEICLQGPVPQSESADAYLGLVRRISATAPDMHLHAYRVPEVRDAANRLALTPREFLEAARDAGVGTVPGTAAQVLDDEVRGVLTPDGLSVAEWVETITTAHGIGLRSTATMLYGHVETPAQQIAHLRLLVDIQRRTGGFTELILMPMLPENAPPHLRAQAVRGPSLDETRALHAVARLLTLGAIDHLQAAWTKLDEVALDAVLRGGADDVGGVLIDGRLRPDAGPESGRQLVPAQVAEIAGALGRTTRQRTTLYETAPDDRQAVLQKVFA